jgi:hypothetical protein
MVDSPTIETKTKNLKQNGKKYDMEISVPLLGVHYKNVSIDNKENL